LAEACGLHRTYISSIERGERNVSLDNIEKLADAFDIPIRELLSGAEAIKLTGWLTHDPRKRRARKK
jgi:transcriptional regulator with XRE-family HTH domain